MTWHRNALGYWRLTSGPHWVADVGDASSSYPGWIVYALPLSRGPDPHIASGPEQGEAGKAAVEQFLLGLFARLAFADAS